MKHLAYLQFPPAITEEVELIHKEIFEDEIYKPLNTPTGLVDLGGHIGLSSLYFADKFTNINIDIYEPNPSLTEYLTNNTSKIQQRRVFPLAVSDKPKSRRVLYYIDDNLSISTLNPESNPLMPWKQTKIQTVTLAEVVETFVKEYGELPSHLKMDIEGHEASVIKSSAIQDFNYIIVEVHESTISTSKLTKVLINKGFKIVRDIKTYGGYSVIHAQNLA